MRIATHRFIAIFSMHSRSSELGCLEQNVVG